MTTVVVSPGPSTPTTFSAQIPLPTEPANVPLPPVALVEITTTHPSDSAADTLAKLLSVDGAGSGLDADLLDSHDTPYFLDWANFTGQPATFPPTLPIAESDVINLVSDLAAKASLADLAAKAPLADPVFTGDPRAVTVANTDSDTSIATTAFVHSVRLDQMAQPFASIGMNGQLITSLATPVNPTDAATKAYADSKVSTVTGTAPVVSSGGTTPAISMAAATGSVPGYLTAADWTTFNGKASLASPVFTGDPQAPTPAAIDNDTSIATTAFVKTALVAGGAVPTAEARNRIVNPAMQVSQENADTAGTTNNYYCADQWFAGITGIVASTARTAPAAPPNGSAKAIYLQVTTPKGSLAAGDNLLLWHKIEGVNIADFRWGAAGARQVVLRFWAYSSVTGNFTAAIRNSAIDRSYLAAFNIPTINTWTPITIVVPGDTTGTWLADTGIGLQLTICFAAGTTFEGAAGWQAGNKFSITGSTNGAAAANAMTIADAGLYLDRNSTGLPPAWQFPNEADELIRCLRYFERSYTAGVATGAITTAGCVYGVPPSTVLRLTTRYLIPKRVIPTLTTYSTATGASGQVAASSGGDVAFTPAGASENNYSINIASVANVTYTWQWVASARL
jgi:hypothetical protein